MKVDGTEQIYSNRYENSNATKAKDSATESESISAKDKDQVEISQEGKEALEKSGHIVNSDEIREMIKKDYQSLAQNASVDPIGEIAQKAFIEERLRQLKESIDVVQCYYASANAENQTHDDPYNYIVNKYNSKRYEMFHSTDFRSDMTEDQRRMAQAQELSMLYGKGPCNLSDPYAWASRGGVPTFEEREQQVQDAVQKALDDKKAELEEQNRGKGDTRLEQMLKAYDRFCANVNNGVSGSKMGDKQLKL